MMDKEAIRELRHRLGLSQEGFARNLGAASPLCGAENNVGIHYQASLRLLTNPKQAISGLDLGTVGCEW